MPGENHTIDAVHGVVVHGSPWSASLVCNETSYLYENLSDLKLVMSVWFHNAPGQHECQLGMNQSVPVPAGTTRAVTWGLEPYDGIWAAGPNPSSRFAFQILMVDRLSPEEDLQPKPESPPSDEEEPRPTIATGLTRTPAHVIGLRKWISVLEGSLAEAEKDPKRLRDQIEQARKLLGEI